MYRSRFACSYLFMLFPWFLLRRRRSVPSLARRRHTPPKRPDACLPKSGSTRSGSRGTRRSGSRSLPVGCGSCPRPRFRTPRSVDQRGQKIFRQNLHFHKSADRADELIPLIQIRPSKFGGSFNFFRSNPLFRECYMHSCFSALPVFRSNPLFRECYKHTCLSALPVFRSNPLFRECYMHGCLSALSFFALILFFESAISILASQHSLFSLASSFSRVL